MIPPRIPDDENERLAALKATGLLDSPAEERFDRITRLAQKVLGVPIALVSLVDKERQWFKSAQGLGVTETSREVSFCAHAILGDDVFEVNDATADERFADNPLVAGRPDIRFYAGCPLNSPEGKKIGTLCLIDRAPRSLSEEQKRSLRDLASMVEHEIGVSHQRAALERMREVQAAARRRGEGGAARRRLRRGFGAAVALSLGLAGLSLFGQRRYAEGSRWVQHTQEVLGNLTGLVGQAKAQQAGARGFVITGDESFFVPVASERTIEERLSRIRALVADNPDQLRRLDQIAAAYARWKSFSDETIAARRSSGFAAAAKLVGRRRAQASMDDFVAAVDRMSETERELLDERRRESEAEARILEWTSGFGGLAGTLIVLFAMMAALKDEEARERAEAELISARDSALRDAEARAAAQAEAQRVSERLNAVLEHIQDGVVLVNADGSMPIFNSALERIHGAWREDFERLYRSGEINAMRPDGAPMPREEAALGRVLKGEIVKDQELYFKTRFRPSGYMVSVSASPVRDGQGRIIGGVFVLRDITDAKRLERYRALQYEIVRVLAQTPPGKDAVPDLLKALGEKMGWVYAGFFSPDAAGKVLRPTFSWTFASAGPVAAFAEQTRRFSFEPGVGLPGRVWREKRPVWLSDTTNAQNFPRRDIAEAAGLRGAFAFPATVAGKVTGVIEVFSARIEEPDEDLLALVDTLGAQIGLALEGRRAQDERTRFFNLSLDMMCVAGFDGKFKALNGTWEKTLGWAPEEMLGIPFMDLAHPDDKRATVRQAARSARGRAVFQFENRYRCKDGSYKNLLWNIVSVVEEGLVYATARDVTDMKRVMAELAEARDAALGAAKAKSDFLANMSHEIRTPMNAIIGMTGLLLDMVSDARQREYLETVRGAGDALLALINDILDFSKIEAGRLSFETIDFDLRDTVERAVELVAHRAQEKGLEMTVSVPPDAPTALRGDPGRLRQVLLNLLGNAVKFTEKGEVAVGVSAVERDGRRFVAVTVRDTGIGIPADALPRLFRSFSQVDSSTTRKYGGTGLGLAISKQLVELMGGRVTVDSARGRGSIFRVEIPFEAAQSAPAERRGRAAPDLAAVRAIVIDDNATNREIVRAQLAAWNMLCDQADGAAAGLERMRAAAAAGAPYGLAILDYQMPETDGLALARAIRADAALARTPMILMTSLGGENEFAASAREGLAACLAKPVRQSTLFDGVMTALGRGPVPTRRAGAPAPAAPGAATPDSPAVPTRRLRVLVVEDNSVNQKVILLQLGKLGHAADAVASGVEALESLEKISYELVLMDCQMPIMDGFEATRELRRREAALNRRRMPVIALTANAMAEDRRRCLDAGMDDYLSKPVAIDALARAIAARAPRPVNPGVVKELREMAGDEGFRAVRAEFLDGTDHILGRLRRAADAGETDSMTKDAHTLKGSASSLGAEGLASLCRELESRLAAGAGPVECAAIVARMAGEFQSVRRELEAL